MNMPVDQAKHAVFPILAMDVSERRIGLAIATSRLAAPQPLYTYARTTRAEDLQRCREWITRYQIQSVVIGLPLNMDGSSGERARWMRRFARQVQQLTDRPVMLFDERLSTVEAREYLAAQGLRPEEQSERVDAVAAALILERFLQSTT